jgi:hypothetical protein
MGSRLARFLPWLRRHLVFLVPFAFSLSLSISTVGGGVFWQDSGFYLVAVHDLSLLYPHGHVLYQMLCKAWTVIFFFLDFTLAVHLFSSFCAAGAAGTLAVAGRDLLRARGSLFRVTQEPEPGGMAALAGAAAGCLAAGGFTFWFTGLYAKGYALYYWILALLLWRMIRAAESGRPRDYTRVAALIGLSWAAHPSAALAGLAFLLFAATSIPRVGWRGLLWRGGLAAACAVGPALAAVPLLVARGVETSMDHPSTPGELARFLLGQRYTHIPDVFGWDAARVSHFGQYLWEEMLGIGLVFVTVGLIRMTLSRPPLALAVLAWMVPYSVVTILFKIEGQHDCWFIASWMPLYPAMAVGIYVIGTHLGRAARPAIAASAAVGAAWAVIANFSHLDQRRYDLAEIFGRIHLSRLPPNAVLVLYGDDPLSTARYLQRVRGERRDVLIVQGNLLDIAPDRDGGWYDDRLLRSHPELRPPAYGEWRSRFRTAEQEVRSAAAFISANLDCSRPLYTNVFVPGALLSGDRRCVPAGPLMKVVPRSDQKVDLKDWAFPIEAEQVRTLVRRERGIAAQEGAGLKIAAQSYESRLIRLILIARHLLADWSRRQGSPELSVRLLESVRALNPESESDPGWLHSMGYALAATGQEARAQPLLERSAATARDPWLKANALAALAKLAKNRGRPAEAEEYLRRAREVRGLSLEQRLELERQSLEP